MSLTQRQSALVAEFLAKGGTIRKVDTPAPAIAEDVLRYLQEGKVDVRAVVEPGALGPKYIYKDRVITEKQLVMLANRRRKRRRQLPFKLISGSTDS